jgi:hypothetical protein
MIPHLRMPLFSLVALATLLPGPVYAQVPSAIAVPGQNIVTTLHAEGAQVYECKVGPDTKLVWQAREPIATLLLDGKTAGRHYAGPIWELADGSSVTAKAVANSPGATPNDILWLKLEVTSQRGDGGLYGVTSVQRINTKGGMAQGPCDGVGTYQSVPYSADYVFLGNGS